MTHVFRFLNEDPWERLRILRKEMPNTKLQMLFRGQNMLGYRHYADDLVEYFVQKSIANGIDIIRIFDALNDIQKPRNSYQGGKEGKRACAGCCLIYTWRGISLTSITWTMQSRIEECRCRFNLYQGYGGSY